MGMVGLGPVRWGKVRLGLVWFGKANGYGGVW